MSKKDYSTSYTDEGFWNKITKMPGDTGCALLRAAFTLYVLLKEPSTPLWAKTAIIGALGYLIFPFDLFPDPIFTDDLMVMSTLIMTKLCGFINSDILKRVNAMLPERCRGIYIEPTFKP